MRRFLAWFMTACFLLYSAPTVPVQAQGLAALTVGSVIQNIESLVRQLETSAHALLEQGNNALAQQQITAAGILRQFALQLSDIYKGRLDDTFDKFAAAQGNIAMDVQKVLANVGGLEQKSAEDVQKTVYQMQGSVNQILRTLPLTTHQPVFYGMVVHDIYSEIARKGIDLELLGLNLTDPKLDFKAPVVKVAGEVVPSANISVQEDRVQVILPEAIKAKVGLRENYCAPRASFPVSLQSFFKTDRSFIFIDLGKETSITYNAFALPSPEVFLANVSFSGVTRSQSDSTESFKNKSGEVTVGCEEDRGGTVSVTLPDRAKEVTCKWDWVDPANIKNRSANCVVAGSTVSATGTITGLDRDCVVSDILGGGLIKVIVGRKTACNCRGGGHAWLQITGTYKVEQAVEGPFAETVPPKRFSDILDIPIPSDTSRQIRSIEGEISRPMCQRALDHFKMNLPNEPTTVTSASSDNGLFAITYRNERLNIDKK